MKKRNVIFSIASFLAVTLLVAALLSIGQEGNAGENRLYAIFSGLTGNRQEDEFDHKRKGNKKSGSWEDFAAGSDAEFDGDGEEDFSHDAGGSGAGATTSAGGKQTLMIYMIGSDLESRGAAGTDDMEELEESGINLDKTNVVIYAGGSTKWHNDVTSEEKINILQLTKDGFQPVTRMDSASMGTPDSLAEFLNYGYENYPADSYALIMWDHGNGPNIGYGLDMLFDKDSMTLSEMKTALKQSPFHASNKLAWVGFDACLMASAELVCIWDEYADYLVASQEIEPAFGWNYEVFGSYHTKDTKEFLSELTEQYLSSCVEYYENKGLKNKEITLAYVDLSYGDDLERIINELFAKASADIDAKYDTLVRQRVATRAFGRATTGSEYDLVDLGDMATQLSSIYPEEAEELLDVVDRMVLKNGTNAKLCCGLSLYYPFYNKYHYEESWAEIYAELGVLETYNHYLNQYRLNWLEDENLEQYEKSPVPEKVGSNRSSGIEGTYKLVLSPEQNANYAEAKVYILENSGGEKYFQVMASSNVKNIDGVLYADVIDKAIYVKDDFGNRDIPMTEHYDTVGDISRFGLRLTATNYETESTAIKDMNVFNVQMALDHKTQTPSIMAVNPYNPPTKANEIMGGKLEEGDLSLWEEYSVLHFNNKYMTRNEAGLVLPLEEWVSTGWIRGTSFSKENGFHFAYETMDGGLYYLIFEITDTQGNKYCSEVLPIEPAEMAETDAKEVPEDIVIEWSEGSSVELLNEAGVTVTLRKEFDGILNNPVYKLEVVNQNSYPVEINIEDILFDGICADDSWMRVSGNSKETGNLFYWYNIEDAVGLKQLDEITNIQAVFRITSNDGASYMVDRQKVIVTISKQVGYGPLIQYHNGMDTIKPYRGALAEEQELYQDDKIKIKLIMLGSYSGAGKMYILCENLTEEPQGVAVAGLNINGKTIAMKYGINFMIPGKSKYLKEVSFEVHTDFQRINQIESVQIHFSGYKKDRFGRETFTPLGWQPVFLTKSGKDEPDEVPVGEVIYDKNNIRITVTGFDLVKESYGEELIQTWYAVVENHSDENVTVEIESFGTASDGIYFSGLFKSYCVGAHQKAYTAFEYDPGNIPRDGVNLMEDRTFKIHIADFYEAKLLFKGEDLVTLHATEIQDKGIYAEMTSQERVKLAEFEQGTLYIKKEVNYKNQSVYSLELESLTDTTLQAVFNATLINDVIKVGEYNSSYVTCIEPGTKSGELSLGLDVMYGLGAIEEIFSLEGYLSVMHGSGSDQRKIMEKIPVRILFSGDGKIDFLSEGYRKEELTPYLDASAEEQVLLETEKIRLKLIRFGENSLTRGHIYLEMENLADTTMGFRIPAMSANDITVSFGEDVVLKPGQKEFRELTISDSWILENNISSIGKFEVYLETWEGEERYLDTPVETVVLPVILRDAGEEEPYIPGENVIFDKNGVKIILNQFAYELGSYSFYSVDYSEEGQRIPTWFVTIVNDSDRNIDLSNVGETSSYVTKTANLTSYKVGAKERINSKISPMYPLDGDNLSLRIKWKDWRGNRIFADEEEISLQVVDEELRLTPYLDAIAEEQVLLETDAFRVKLMFLGNNNRSEEKLWFCVENLTDKYQSISISTCAMNGITIPMSCNIDIDANSTIYAKADFSEEYLKELNITTIETLAFKISDYTDSSPSYIPKAIYWASVNLKQSGKAEEFVPGDTVLFEQEGVKIILDGFAYLEDGRAAWNVTVINETDEEINLTQSDSMEYIYSDQKNMVFLSPTAYVGPRQRLHGKIHSYSNRDLESLEFNIMIKDSQKNILYQDDELITLYTGDGKNFTKTKR